MQEPYIKPTSPVPAQCFRLRPARPIVTAIDTTMPLTYNADGGADGLQDASCCVIDEEGATMVIKWLGHATFLLTTSSGTKIITDPYEPGAFGAINHAPINVPADIVTVSHEHSDHNNVAGVPGSPAVVRGAGDQTVLDVKFHGVATFHDTSQGSERGTNTVFVMEADGLRVCHMGDLGHLLDDAAVRDIGAVDVLLIPVGGTFTLTSEEASTMVEKLGPKLVIPMHFQTARCSLPITTVDGFVAGKTGVESKGANEIAVDAGSLPGTMSIVVLEPAL